MKHLDREILMSYPLNKGLLAMMYSPHVCRKSALRLLNKFIHNAHGLLDALEQVGYSRAARNFTRRQLELILLYIGEPL